MEPSVATVRVELHCHSSLSDGRLSPEETALQLAKREVRFAALTDHETLDGQSPFRDTFEAQGKTAITGLETTAFCGLTEIHLLAYGFDENHAGLNAFLTHRRNHREANRLPTASDPENRSAFVIALLHQAGGMVFMAHPAQTESDLVRLNQLVNDLKKEGLNGLEGYYAFSSPEERNRLLTLAAKESLLVSAGTDAHFTEGKGSTPAPGLDLPEPLWNSFRQALLSAPPPVGALISDKPKKSGSSFFRTFALHHIIPALLTLLLFATTLFFIFLPALEQSLMDRKREMIRELTNTAVSVLDQAFRDEQSGRLTRVSAQEQAAERISAIRYGREGKDYFWIQDTLPHMIRHPYRTDLDQTDLSAFRDARGVRIFTLFADLAKKRKQGYVDYVWQWKDDPSRLLPKESYIRLFEPWGWIVGTGVYIQDVQTELHQIEKRLLLAFLIIALILALLLFYLLREGLRSERKRRLAEAALQETTSRYRTLSETATEGTLLALSGQCRYANPAMLELIGCTAAALPLLVLSDLFPDQEANHALRRRLSHPWNSGEGSAELIAELQRRDGTLLSCRLMLRPLGQDDRTGLLLLVRRIDAEESGLTPAARAALDRLLRLPATVAGDVAGDIRSAARISEIAALCGRTTELTRSLLNTGASAPAIARMLSTIADAATERLVTLSIEEMGPPPCPFVFVASGSQGRQEQTLFTDQDNALIFLPTDKESVEQSYFLALADKVCKGLSQAGYPDCKGGAMANNPEWCRSLPAWKNRFSEWIQTAKAQALMEFSLFFDLRAVYGETGTVADLKEHIFRELRAAPWFFTQAAQNALSFKPPLRLFGTIVTKGADKEQDGRIDLKAAALPIVAFARLYSLQEQLPETNTLARLEALCQKGRLLPSKARDVVGAHEALLRLRLSNQIASFEQGAAPDNRIDYQQLGHIEKAVLRESFSEIDALQARIRREFLAGG